MDMRKGFGVVILMLLMTAACCLSCSLFGEPDDDDDDDDTPDFDGIELPSGSDFVQVAADDEAVILCFIDGMAVSFDGGVTWEEKSVPDSGDAYYTSGIFFMGDTLCMVHDVHENGSGLIYYASEDYGDTWEARSINWGAYDLYEAFYSGGCLFVVFKGGEYGMTLARSDDAGETWSFNEITVADFHSGIFDDAENIGACGKDAVIHILYHDGDTHQLKILSSFDKGETWEGPALTDEHGGVGTYCSIQAMGSGVISAYYDYANTDLYMAKNTLALDSDWETSLVDYEGNIGMNSCLHAGPDMVCISYWDKTYDRIKVACSGDGGLTWTRSVMDTGEANGSCSSVFCAGSAVYAAFTDIHKVDWEYYTCLRLAKSMDGGSTWTYY